MKSANEEDEDDILTESTLLDFKEQARLSKLKGKEINIPLVMYFFLILHLD